jgi:predicted metalloprotease
MRLKDLRRRRGGTIDVGRGSGARPMGLPIGAGLGGGGLLLLIAVIVIVSLLGGDDGATGPGIGGGVGGGGDAVDAATQEYVDAIVDDIQTAWDEEFADNGLRYEDTVVALFADSVSTGCGNATSAVGPFYCPLDQRVYLDVSFFDELERRFGAAGDFAEAYVIAHEVGHHVQSLLGTERRVREASQRNPGQKNELSVRLELQADCYAGFWGRTAREEGILEQGDLEEGLEAAAAIGDDRIQESVEGRVNPETWTHGSAEMRRRWFRTGFQLGNPDGCDTFSIPYSEL